MTRRLLLQVVLLFLLLSNFVYAYDYLRVRDPRGWHSMQGTIEEAVVSVKPKGIYMEVGLYLTFSARDWYYSANDSLEVEFYFDLPENSIVHDSWLWIDDQIIRGEIMDKWTAASIYEEIVKRRRDPSILYKRYGNSYELRIFPMLASETRKVKITYLVPAQWSAKSVSAALPTNLLNTSRYDLSTFYLLTWLDEDWQNPQILEFPNIEFMSKTDEIFGNYMRADLPTDAIQSTLNFTLDAPLKNGVYLSSMQNGDKGIYQLAFLPSQALEIENSTKVTVCFDYDPTNCDIGTNEVLAGVKSYLKSNYTERDSFNLVFSQLNINRISESWLAADSITIENIFSNLGDTPISNYSNLPSLLANGIEFIKSNGNDGNIVLVASTDQVGDYEIANQLIDDLLDLTESEIPIHVADFQDRSYSYHYIGGRYYYGNEYFYTNISRLTSANYYSARNGYTFSEVIGNTFSSVSGFLSSFDLYTSLSNGFCYSRFNINGSTASTYLDRPILQIGKFQGEFPFLINASGSYESEVFSQQTEINSENSILADSLIEEMWVGNYINYLENEDQSNDIINEIVTYSLSERVLSIYSAFLCLEPARGGEVCYDCLDESGLVGIEEFEPVIKSDSLLNAYPNPFNNTVKIDIALPKSNSDISFEIYNVLGQVVREFRDVNSIAENKYQITWDGTSTSGSSVSSGTYFFIVTSGNKRYSHKLMLMK